MYGMIYGQSKMHQHKVGHQENTEIWAEIYFFQRCYNMEKSLKKQYIYGVKNTENL